MHILNPEVIILGGGLSLMGEPLREGVEMNLNQFIMSAMQPGPEVKLSMLKEDVVPVGALYLALMNK